MAEAFGPLYTEGKENQGKGEAIKTALQYIRAELWEYGAVGIMDADGQHLPEDMEKLLMRAGRNPGTLVLGTRNLDQSTPWKSRFGNQITRKIFKLMTGAEISDTQTGLRAFSSELLDYLLFIIFMAVFPSSAAGVLGANIGARVLSAVYNYMMNCRFVFHKLAGPEKGDLQKERGEQR